MCMEPSMDEKVRFKILLRDWLTNQKSFSKPMKGKLNNMVEYFKNEAENLINDYNGLINGLFVRNPGTKGYTVRVSMLEFLQG